MIKNGVSKLKKHNIFYKNLFIFVSLLFLVLGGCSSTPKLTAKKVHPLDLVDPYFLNTRYDFYIYIPENAEKSIISKIIKNKVNGIDDKTTSQIVSNLNTMAIGFSKGEGEFTMAIDSNISSNYAAKMIKKIEGFNESKTETQVYSYDKEYYCQVPFSYYWKPNVNDYTHFSFLNNSIICASSREKDILKISDQYYQLATNLYYDYNMNSQYNFINKIKFDGNDDEIRFCVVSNIKDYLSYLIGDKLNVQIESVWGCFKENPNNDKAYLLDFTLEFKSSSYKRASKSLISLAFGISDGIIEDEENPCLLTIKGIDLNKEQLYKILSF